jgi:predicted GNAT family N-acyltransferase
MQKPPLDPDVADEAPSASALTGYDEQNLITYLRLLDAEEDGADWIEVARIVLHLDPDREPQHARRAWETHLARARWMKEHGYRHLLRGGTPH